MLKDSVGANWRVLTVTSLCETYLLRLFYVLHKVSTSVENVEPPNKRVNVGLFEESMISFNLDLAQVNGKLSVCNEIQLHGY